MMTLGESLPIEMARVRDDVMPAYVAIGVSGQFALTMMRQALDGAAMALAEGDVLAMLRCHEELIEILLTHAGALFEFCIFL